MQTTAKVISVDGSYATVRVSRTSACEGCHKSAEGSCSVCTLMGSGKKTMESRAANPVGASVGDTVVVESRTGRVLWYAVLVFLLPLAAAFLGWGVASAFTDEELWQIVGALAGFAGAFLAAFLYSGWIGKKRCDIEITEILAPQNDTH